MAEVPHPLEEAIRYLETQHDWMGNYQQWQADGYPVGSGLIERAVTVVINMRMNKTLYAASSEPLPRRSWLYASNASMLSGKMLPLSTR